MSPLRKWLTAGFLALVLWVIVVTWGSIGSAVLTLGLLLALGFLALRWFQETHDPDDFDWEG